MSFRFNPAELAALKVRLGTVALAGAEGAVEPLQEKLTGAGTGRKYAPLPNRSSAQGEYPAEQSGALRESIAAAEAGEMRAQFGPINNPPDYVEKLHFKPPSDGGRPFMDDALQDRDIRAGVIEGVQKEADRQFGRVTVRRRG